MKKLVLILAFLALPLTSHAQDAFYLSGMLGLTTLDNGSSGYTADDLDLSYGARAGVLFNDHFSAGLFLHRAATEGIAASLPIDVSVTNIMAEVTYYFAEADENSFWVSGLLGTSQTDLSGPGCAACGNESDTAYGASLGYHFMVAPNFSVSPQFTYIFVDSSPETTAQMSGLVNLTMWL